MALKLVDGKEIRVPGGTIPEAQRRKGALGLLDWYSFREFQKLSLLSQIPIISDARQEKAEERDYWKHMAKVEELKGTYNHELARVIPIKQR